MVLRGDISQDIGTKALHTDDTLPACPQLAAEVGEVNPQRVGAGQVVIKAGHELFARVRALVAEYLVEPALGGGEVGHGAFASS